MELPALLTFTTLLLVALFAYVNSRVTKKQLDEKNFTKSTLCATSSHWMQRKPTAAR
ncbi:MAG: hypothetical protein AAF755_07845 [Pseudomonadota bacterium]